MSKIKAVVLGAGAWSRSSHLPTLTAQPDVEVAALSSLDAGGAAEAAAIFNVPRWTTDWRQALAERPDVAIVSSPPVAHEDQVIAALDAGAHVLVEKPFALEAASAARMRDAARAAGRHLLVGFGWPAAPIFVRARELIASGAVGPIEHLTMHLAVNTRSLLMGSTDGGWGGVSQSLSSTYTDPRVSAGGAVAVSMSHQIGLIEWLLGEAFVAVNASTFPQRDRLDLHASVNAELSGGGSAAISAASTHPYLARPQWHMALYGSGGQIWLDTAADYLRFVRADGRMSERFGAEALGVYDLGAPTRALVACARGEVPPAGMTADLAVRVVAVTDAIYESARTGAKLRIQSP